MAKLLMIVAPEGYRDEELDVPKAHFEGNGHNVTVASTRKGTCTGMKGGSVEATFSLGEVNMKHF